MLDAFSALADPTRRLLLERLHRERGQALRGLGDGIAITRQAMAKHLGILERSALVVGKRVGREKLYFINTEALERSIDGWMAQFRASQPRAAPPDRPAATPEAEPAHRRRRKDTRKNHLSKLERVLRGMSKPQREEWEKKWGETARTVGPLAPQRRRKRTSEPS